MGTNCSHGHYAAMANTEPTKRKMSGRMAAFVVALLIAGAIVAAIYLLASTPGEVPPVQ